jgi:hypothetical protein
LRSSPEDFVAAADSNDNREKSSSSSSSSDALWKTICKRVGIAPCNIPGGMGGPILPRYEKISTHFEVRAALVLEEARHAISQPLAALWCNSNNNNNSNGGRGGSGGGGGRAHNSHNKSNNASMILTAYYSEKSNSNGHARVVFKKDRPFSHEELYNIRPGAVFQCLPRENGNRPRSLHNVVLGMMFTGNREQVEKKKEFQIVMFRDLPSGTLVEGSSSEWIITPLTSLITELRCFEAMVESAGNVSFMHDLLGKRMATSSHTRFDPYTGQPIKSGDETALLLSAASEKQKNSSDNDSSTLVGDFSCALTAKTATCSLPPLFKHPLLNKTQEQAASTFLKSPQNTITLIQGPPGV